jgi:flavin-dependent dehydrogenase
VPIEVDVVVIGGGPGGSVCAAELAQRGRRVTVFERARHPRFHLGESLLPGSVEVLDAIGVLREVRARFQVKRGARFVDGADAGRSARYVFSDAYHVRSDHAFQVPRDAFDELLFRAAAERGADAREGWEVTRVLFEDGRAAGVEARGDGREETVRARFVVDASGRDAVLPRKRAAIARVPHLDRTALYTQALGAWRDSGEREGDIQIVVFGAGDERGWFWLIPFSDGRSSAGAVVSSAWMRARSGRAPEDLFAEAVAQAPSMRAMLDGSRPVFAPRATADFSFTVSAMHGEGWLAVGDAAGFIDPLFSTGAHLAMSGGLRAARAIDEAMKDGDQRAARFDAWAHEMRAGSELFLGAVQAFYAGDLADSLFAEPQHPFLRRAITSLLAGDVFDRTPPWRSALAARFPVAQTSF